MLSKLGYPIKGGFANGTGRSAYLSTCAVWEISSKNASGVPLKKKNKTYPRKHPKKLPREAHTI